MAEALAFHTLSEKWRLLDGDEFRAMVDSIREIGLTDDILLYEGKIVDGRNRYRACREAGVEPRFTTWEGSEEELLSHLDGRNDARRHDEQEVLRKRRAERANLVAQKKAEGKSNRQIAEEVGVSESQVRSDLLKSGAQGGCAPESVTGKDGKTYDAGPMKKVLADGIPELRHAAANGQVSIKAAAKLSALPAEKQKEALESHKKTHTGASARAKADARIKRQEKNGKPVYDDREIENQIGRLVRTFDARAKVHGRDGGFEDVEKQMELLLAAWRRWQRETTGAKR